LYVVSFVFGSSLSKIREYKREALLLVLWLLITPLVLLAINAWSVPIFQIRYTIAILPAWSLLVAYSLRFSFRRSAISGQPSEPRNFFQKIAGILYAPHFGFLPIILIIWLVYTQLVMYAQFWPDKPRWEEAIRQMTATRQPLEPAITAIAPQSPAAYYDRLYGIRQGIALDLSWRWQETEDINRYVGYVANAPSVWVIMPSHHVSTWDAVTGLLDGRRVGYRDTVMNTIFYRLDTGAGDGLHFRFGDAVAYDGGIGHQLYARAGEPFCFDSRLTTLKPLENERIEWQLTQGYGTVRAALSAEMGAQPAGETINLSPCMDIPPNTPAGPHHLRLSILNEDRLLPLIESENLYWGEQLVLAQVSVLAGE
jgi:hypothetical protein